MYFWMLVVAAILFLPSSECRRCNGRNIQPTSEGIPLVMDSVTATNFSFVARSFKEFDLRWNASCDSWNQGDIITFKFVQTTKRLSRTGQSFIGKDVHKNYTSCRSSEVFTWEPLSYVQFNISFRNVTSPPYCYRVYPKSVVLPAPEIQKIDNLNPTEMSLRARTKFSIFAECIWRYREDHSVDSDWQEVTCSGVECNIAPLKPAGNYSVKIACGIPPIPPISWSDPKVFSTPMAAPSGVVRDVKVKDTDDSGYRRSVNASWQTIPEDHQNGEILFYTISVLGTTCDTSVKTYKTSMLSYIIHDLYYRCDYCINITASNLVGESTPRVTSLERLKKPPSDAREFTAISISSESIQLSWKDPEQPYGEINYTLSVHRVNSETLEQRVEMASNSGSETGQVESYTVTGLAPFTTYRLNLEAKNHFSASDGINLEKTTSESVPSEGPVGLTLERVPKQVTNLSVTWGPVPEDHRNGVIINYTIYWWQPDHAFTCRPALPLNALNITVTGVSHIIEDLKDDTSYCVTVTASTSVGEGPMAEVQNITTLKATVTVKNITVTSTTSDSISLEWNLPKDVNSTLLQLQIYHNEARASFKLGPQVCSQDLTSHTLKNLKPYTNYSISVQACWDNAVSDSCGDNETVFARTISTFPSEPTDLMTRHLAQDHVNLTWHPPVRPNGPISHYQVTFYQDTQTSHEEKQTESLSMSLTIPCSSIGSRRIFVFKVAAVVDGLKGPAAKRNTTMCIDVPRVSELNIALIGIPGFLISVLLSVACCCALAPRRKLEIKHAKAIYEPKMVSSCGKAPEKEKFDTLKCQSATKLENVSETYVPMHPKKFTALTSTSNQSYMQMSRGGGYLPDLT